MKIFEENITKIGKMIIDKHKLFSEIVKQAETNPNPYIRTFCERMLEKSKIDPVPIMNDFLHSFEHIFDKMKDLNTEGDIDLNRSDQFVFEDDIGYPTNCEWDEEYVDPNTGKKGRWIPIAQASEDSSCPPKS